MDYKASEEAVDGYVRALKRVGIPLDHYKALECIFRQALMKDAAYKYNHDWVEQALFGKMPSEVRWKRLQEYISKWESNSGMHYGLELVKMNEVDHISQLVEEYERVREKLLELGQQNGLLLEAGKHEDWIVQLQKNVRSRIGINNREPGRLLVFNKNGSPVKNEINHEYFKYFLGMSWAVFHEYFSQLADYKNEHVGVNQFLSLKIQHQHQEIRDIGKFTSKEISRRLNDNKGAKDRYLNLIWKDLHLMDYDFIQFLIKQVSVGHRFAA